jgi:hypothetical protein
VAEAERGQATLAATLGAGCASASPMAASLGAVLLAVALLLQTTAGQQTIKLSSTLTLEKGDDKAKTYEQILSLAAYAKEKKLESNVIRFLENTVQQMEKVLEAAKIVEQQKAVEIPKDFTPGKYRVKSMPKLQTKKITTKKISAKDLKKRLQEGKDLSFSEPMLVTNATALFDDGSWNEVRRHWSAARIADEPLLEKNMRLEYWPPDKARARLIGNQLQMEEPEMVAFSKYLIICFAGSPAKPKLPGQNTDHCEQNVDAQSMVLNDTELTDLNIFPEIKNALPLQAAFRQRLIEAGASELAALIGKGYEKWKRQTGQTHHQFFTFGPSGSGDKLKMENGLPFYDVLIHGSRRWLLLKEEEMERVAKKAREALEFDKTSAYMFFEEKLPELKEEFGLKKYVECNQNAGDLVIVPSGWYRVSLSLADSISYYETLLSEKHTLEAVTDNNVWRPQFRQFGLAFCQDPKDIDKLPGVSQDPGFAQWLTNALSQVKLEESITSILQVLFTCGSVLALEKSMPQFKVSSLTQCTPAVWKQCRKKLEAKALEKNPSLKFDWLPKEAPTSMDDIPMPAAMHPTKDKSEL